MLLFDDPLPFSHHHADVGGYEGTAFLTHVVARQQRVGFIAFDILEDYRIGHLKPGAEVDHRPPNPADDKLGSWLKIVNDWSAVNPGHEPITIVLDAKDDLTDNVDADLEELNRRVEAAFAALHRETRERAMELGERRGLPEEVLHNVLDSVTDPGRFADLVAGYIELPVDEKQALLETLGVGSVNDLEPGTDLLQHLLEAIIAVLTATAVKLLYDVGAG